MGRGAAIPEYTSNLYGAVARHTLTVLALVGKFQSWKPVRVVVRIVFPALGGITLSVIAFLSCVSC